MQRKYQFTDETMTLCNSIVLSRIQALRDGPWGPVGTPGGWIQLEDNLSHEGDCWVSDEAVVYSGAMVFDNAKILEDATVYGRAQVYENAYVSQNARVYQNAKVFGNANIFETARVYESAFVFGNTQVFGYASIFGHAQVSGNQKVNGCCYFDGHEKGQEFQVNDVCVCGYDTCLFEEYYGCAWIISAIHEGWVQAKHGSEEIAFRNEWLRKV